MAKWKYDPSKLKTTITKNPLKALTVHWDKAVKLEKEIREQTLRQVMPTFSDKYEKDVLKRYEGRHTPRFRTFQILGKKIDDVAQNSIKLWKTMTCFIKVLL